MTGLQRLKLQRRRYRQLHQLTDHRRYLPPKDHILLRRMLARYELVETLSSRERRLILRMGVQLDARTYAQVQLEDLAEQHKKLLADRQNGNAVLLSAAEYAQYQQTMQLMALLTSGELKLLRRRQKYQRRCHRHKQLAGLKLELKTYVRDRIQHNTPSRPDIYTRRQVLLREEAHE